MSNTTNETTTHDTRALLECDACAREVGYTQQRCLGPSGHAQLCDDCNALVPKLHERMAWALNDFDTKLGGLLRDWLRECKAHHGQTPWKPAGKETPHAQ